MRVLFKEELSRYVFVGHDVSCLYLRNASSAAPLFVTFDYWRHKRDDVTIYGERFCRKHGFNQAHVFPSRNNWFQTREMEGVLIAVDAVRVSASRVVTYGASMGGHAALQFARRVGADTAIALAPQVVANPRRPPFDNRWPELDSLTFIYDDLDLSGVRNVVAVCDPLCRDDRQQIAQIPQSAAVTFVPVVGGGHSPDVALVGWGLIEDFLLAVLDGNYIYRGLRSEVRSRRRQLDHYVRNMNQHFAARRKNWRLEAATGSA